MKAVELLVDEELPPELRGRRHSLDAKGIGSILSHVAVHYPQHYARLSKNLSDTGRNAAYHQGETITLADMDSPFDKDELLNRMDLEIADLRKRTSGRRDFENAREAVWGKYAKEVETRAMAAARKSNNAIGLAVASGARGKPAQLKMMLSAAGLFADSKDRTVPMFVRHGFNEGLRPAEFMATTFGARKAVISTKRATAQGGDFGKQLGQASDAIVVTEKDCGTENGLDLSIDDPYLKYRVLAKPAGKIEAGIILDKDAAGYLRKAGHKEVVVRSPLTCQAKEGVCARCMGVDARGKFPSIGDSVGTTAAAAIGEPIAQAALNCLVEGTLVRMADMTVRRIEELRVGDVVLGADKEGNTFPSRVTALWDQGIQPTERYTYRLGQTKQEISVDCTTKHPILSNKKVSGKIYFEKYGGEFGFGCPENYQAYPLPAGFKHRRLAAVLPTSCKLDEEIDEPHALLCGVLLGDGIRWDNLKYSEQAPRMSCADPLLVEDLNAFLAEDGVGLKKCKRSHDYRLAYGDTAGWSDSSKSGQFVKTPTRHLVKAKSLEWGIAGKYAHEKEIPPASLLWKKDQVAALIAGFIATDGSVGKAEAGTTFVSFSSCSKALLEGLKLLLGLRLNVYTTALTKTAKAGTKNYVHDLWQFTITRQDQILKLHSQLPRIPGCKGPLFDLLVAEANPELRNPEPFYRASRVRIESLGDRPCWDISVDSPDELFVLHNGLIVHNTKHTGGNIAGGKKEYSGFSWLNQFVQVPDNFRDRAAVSEVEGKVESVKEAPQGGSYIRVAGKDHYVLPGFSPLVKPGQPVEKGDILSDGLASPYDIVTLRGLGSGRRYYRDRMLKLLEDSGTPTDPRNVEVITRGALNHILVKDYGVGDALPDDVIPYSRLEQEVETAPDTVASTPTKAVGKYLQAPVLHYTIGSKLTASQAARLERNGYNKVYVSDTVPNYEPELPRLRTATQANEDWMAGMAGSYLGRRLNDAAIRGQDTNIQENIHYAPRLSVGENFGKNVAITGKF